MTNEMIILSESIRLMEAGKLNGSGEFVEVENEDGSKKHLELPEEIHTFNGWKARGYQVKKGEKSEIKFPIWKHTTKKPKTSTGEDNQDEQGSKAEMFMKVSAFFTIAQVEPIKA